MSDEIGFKTYTWKDIPLNIEISKEEIEASKMFILNIDHIYKRTPPPDTRSKYRKFVDDWKKRVSHALYALKGGECD